MLRAEHVTKKFEVAKNSFVSVSDVSLSLLSNTSYSLLGESGSGKSTLSLMMAALLRPSSGKILYRDKDIWKLSKDEYRKMRKDIQLVLQDTQSALNPRKKVYDSIAEPLRKLCRLSEMEIRRKVKNIVGDVELNEDILDRYPHQLSGGQQSRVCIARAMSIEPKLIIFDESVSGLDVTVQKKILDLLLSLRESLGNTYLFITHDIDAALYMSKYIFVMRNGEIIEEIPNAISYDSFSGSYSKELIATMPAKSPHDRNRKI